MRAALLQLTVSDDPIANLRDTRALLREASGSGAQIVLTPEVTNILSPDRAHQREVLQTQEQDQTLAALRKDAAELGLWLLIGSLALKTDDPDGRFANRSFLISPEGRIVAHYDKIHMFDVEVEDGKSIRESSAYRPGRKAVLAKTPLGTIGMTICYDMRFPSLYRRLAQAGAQVLSVPSAFHPVTGAAHWETLLRARAIETGCFVLAPAQTGTHSARQGKPRASYGHSLAVSPWGEVLADGGTEPGVTVVDLNLADVEICRRRIPSLSSEMNFEDP